MGFKNLIRSSGFPSEDDTCENETEFMRFLNT